MLLLDTKEQHEQIISRAERELSLLSAEEIESHARLQSIDAEQSTLSERQAARNELLSTARATLSQAQQAHSEASTQAKLMQGMMGHADAMEAARLAAHTLTRIGTESASIEARCLDEQEQDQARTESLSSERLTRSERLRTIETERQALQHAKEMAFLAIGNLEHADVQHQIGTIDSELIEMQASLTALQQRRKETVDAGVVRLSPWVNHIAEVQAMIPPRADDTTGTLTRFIALVDGLLENNGNHLSELRRTTPAQQLYNGNFRQIFTINAEDLYLLSSTHPNPDLGPLRRKRDIALVALQEYRATHR